MRPFVGKGVPSYALLPTWGSNKWTFTTVGFPTVSVPVLSNTTVLTLEPRSIPSAPCCRHAKSDSICRAA